MAYAAHSKCVVRKGMRVRLPPPAQLSYVCSIISAMHPPHFRERAAAWHSEGVSLKEVCRRLDIPRGTLTYWLYGKRPQHVTDRICCRCADPPLEPSDLQAYAYLLGQYLGDGHVQHYARTFLLSIYCDARYRPSSRTSMPRCGSVRQSRLGMYFVRGVLASRATQGIGPVSSPRRNLEENTCAG